jgi:hypothetical protein
MEEDMKRGSGDKETEERGGLKCPTGLGYNKIDTDESQKMSMPVKIFGGCWQPLHRRTIAVKLVPGP